MKLPSLLLAISRRYPHAPLIRNIPAKEIRLFTRTRSSQGGLSVKFASALALLHFVLCCSCPAAQSVTLAWNANSEPDIAGYKIYYRSADGGTPEVIDVGNTTTFSVSIPGSGTTYFRVTAYNNASLESQPSPEVSYTTGDVGDTSLLTVVNGTGGGSYPVGKRVVVTANPVPDGSQFGGWTGDVPILSNPQDSTTTATIPSVDVSVTATYTGD
jgi:hypothetical protein